LRFDPPFAGGILRRRYKRFLADIEVACGNVVTMHCPNTGAMLGCAEPDSAVWYSTSASPTRKYPNTLELVRTRSGCMVGVNPTRANPLVSEALEAGLIEALSGLRELRREVAVPDERGRFDFGALDVQGRQVFVEVKSVTLGEGDGRGYFPDAVSERARRHVRALGRCIARGERAALVFCVQHSGVKSVAPADHIDPGYGDALREAAALGVEIYALSATIAPERLELLKTLPVVL
jgi:sugar fermentation stimulation protein A